MTILLDLIIIAIFIVSVILTVRKGFVKSVALIVSFLVALFAAVTLSGPISDFIYDKIIGPGVVKTVETTITESINKTEEGISKSVWDSLPKFVKNNENVSESDFKIDIANVDTAHSVAVKLSQNTVKPIAVSFVKVITSLILFVGLSFLCKFLTKLLSGIFSFSIIGKVNRFLGGILGIVNGTIYAIIFILLTKFLISITGGFLFFTNASISSTYIFKFLLELLPGIF